MRVFVGVAERNLEFVSNLCTYMQNLRTLGHHFSRLATLNCNHIIGFHQPLAVFTSCACDLYD